MYYVEIRPGLRRSGPPRLVPLEDVGRYRGFRSVFAFPVSTVEIIQLTGSTGGLRGLDVYADVFLIDFDDQNPEQFRQFLQAEGIGYSEWHSGGRSYHFHLDLVPVLGAWVPHAMKSWLKKHAPTADMSYLHPAGLFRLPGTYHAKYPGQCKHLLYRHDGKPVELQQPEESVMGKLHIQSDTTPEALWIEMCTKKGAGQRSQHLWKLATMSFELGYDFDQTLEKLIWWNEHMALPAHNEEKLIKQAESAWTRFMRRQG